ncbi:MAG TPA: bifunctional proline dehydrogenase/L-glutamate gamma-semialdehyde dehydrogenase [Acidimicrobiales bacterium]|nr:bifunctional proline dehydrogenase/L-glutamate gamma-semialdehyde dehydrogenase [Acidimicrobiales bacterium]
MSSDQVARTEALAAELLGDAARRRGRKERRQAARMARLMGDPAGRALILALTDEVLRVREPSRAAGVLAGLTRRGRSPLDDWRAAPFLAPPDRAALVLGGRLAPWMPRLVVPLVRARVKREMSGVILPAGERRLARHARIRAGEGIRLNVNVLGEAVLGEDEAIARAGSVAAVLRRPSVDYVSVKVSSICSQLDVLAFEEETNRIASRLRPLYASSLSTGKFVNLDMEEFRDLELTMAVFERVLSEDAFRALNAGIVLQAYLPDSLAAMEHLCRFAIRRKEAGGGWLKVRIVKGANLAMETVEAELHGWPRAPFEQKTETDTNYKRMLALALDRDLEGALRIGVASHNLFDIAWAAVTAEDAGAMGRIEFEMLEGMSPAVAETVAGRFGQLLLYAPIVAPEDLEAAIAYLVRRLDENSGADNFLAHQFDMTLGSPAWDHEAARFRASVAALDSEAALRTRRTQNRQQPEPAEADGIVVESDNRFVNEPDTDFTPAVNRDWVHMYVAAALADGLGEYRPVVDGRPAPDPVSEPGVDPSRPGVTPYRWAPASAATVDAAIAAARRGQAGWSSTSPEQRGAVLNRVAAGLAAARGRLLAVMAVDAAKTVREGDPEVSEAVDFARYYARHIPVSPDFRPYGTVSVVSPWNFPLSIPAGGVLAGLAAGNTVILKPAPETVAVAGELARVLWESGVPPSALQFVPCLDGDESARMITDPAIDAVVLTGSWETARLFQSWRPGLDLHAETSGKNSLVVTATADPDAAIADLLHSAFGHAGQKCSAASLAILEAAVHDDGRFLSRLADAVRTLRVGPAGDAATAMGPLIRPPDGPLADALARLQPGEEWLVEPKQLDGAGYLWSPGVKIGVTPGSSFHLTECFGPVLGIMRAASLDQAISWQNQPPFGLTAGLHALDPAEIERWRGRVEAGNLYVNRGITGAIVGRQPFGGWKRSVVGPGAKAGGPNYVASLGTWRPGVPSARQLADAWRQLAKPADPSGLQAEANVLRYRPLRRVALCGGEGEEGARRAAAVVGADVSVVDDPAAADGVDKVRVLGPVDAARVEEARRKGIWVDAIPVVADARQELLRWVREQAVSESRHRHGNVTGRRPGLLPPP